MILQHAIISLARLNICNYYNRLIDKIIIFSTKHKFYNYPLHSFCICTKTSKKKNLKYKLVVRFVTSET